MKSLVLVNLLLLQTLITISLCEKSVEELLNQGRALLSQGQDNEALKFYNLAVDQDPNSFVTRYKRAAALLSMGRSHAAEQDLDAVLALNPDFDQALLNRAKLRVKLCNPGASDDLQRFIAVSSSLAGKEEAKSLQDEFSVAQKAIQDLETLKQQPGQEQQVIELLGNHIFVTCPYAVNLRMARAQAHEARNEYAEAIADYSKVAQINSNSIVVLLKLYHLHMNLSEVDQALASLKKCLHLDPEHKECFKHHQLIKKLVKGLAKSEDLVQQGKLRDALDQLDLKMQNKNGVMTILRDLELKGDYLKRVLVLQCDVNGRLKRADDAMKACSDLLEVDESNVDALCNRAELYILKEDYDAALRDYNKANEVAGNNQRVKEGIHKVQRLKKQASQRDYYKVLGLDREATTAQIKKAYRLKAKEYHPDKYKGEDKSFAEKKMAEVNQAYEVLSDPELKKRFDNGEDPNDPTGGQGHPGQHPFGGSGGQGHPFFQGGGMPFFQQEGGGGNPFGGGGFQYEFRFG